MIDMVTLNTQLSEGNIDHLGLFPHLDRLKEAEYVFQFDFGLHALPEEPGILIIRGARQYGKSTWLEQQLYNSIREFGPGSAFYLNGENVTDKDDLQNHITALISAFPKQTNIKRIFIDEITAVPNWEIALKRLADAGKIRDILIVTTGSKATDLRRGSEKLPGRKGKLTRSSYLFTPISYQEFHRVCHKSLKSKTLLSYLISGGSPIACAELATHGRIPEYVIELVRDWIEGEIARSGRSRASLLNIMQVLYRFGGTPVGQAKLARESGLANNTVAIGYIEILNDLGCVIPSFPWDIDREILVLRKPCKYHFTNILSAISYYGDRIRSAEEFSLLDEQTQSIFLEWLVAQEISRRAAIKGDHILEPLAFWQNKHHEVDFVLTQNHFLEVKRGKSSPLEFSWFSKQFPRFHLSVINTQPFETSQVLGLSLEEFLLQN